MEPKTEKDYGMLAIGIMWTWIMAGVLVTILVMTGCGAEPLIAEGHYQMNVHWVSSDWVADYSILPPDEVQVWTISERDRQYALAFPGTDLLLPGWERDGYVHFQYGSQTHAYGDYSGGLIIDLYRVAGQDDRLNGAGKATAWLGEVLMVEQVELWSLGRKEF